MIIELSFQYSKSIDSYLFGDMNIIYIGPRTPDIQRQLGKGLDELRLFPSLPQQNTHQIIYCMLFITVLLTRTLADNTCKNVYHKNLVPELTVSKKARDFRSGLMFSSADLSYLTYINTALLAQPFKDDNILQFR